MSDDDMPRLPNEPNRNYVARVDYILLGPRRSMRALIERYRTAASPPTRRIETLKEWSAAWKWVRLAAEYDEGLARRAATEAAAQYLRDMQEHRDRYSKTAKALHGVAVEMLATVRRGNGTAIEYTPDALAKLARALEAANALEARALQVADFLARGGKEEPVRVEVTGAVSHTHADVVPAAGLAAADTSTLEKMLEEVSRITSSRRASTGEA